MNKCMEIGKKVTSYQNSGCVEVVFPLGGLGLMGQVINFPIYRFMFTDFLKYFLGAYNMLLR